MPLSLHEIAFIDESTTDLTRLVKTWWSRIIGNTESFGASATTFDSRLQTADTRDGVTTVAVLSLVAITVSPDDAWDNDDAPSST